MADFVHELEKWIKRPTAFKRADGDYNFSFSKPCKVTPTPRGHLFLYMTTCTRSASDGEACSRLVQFIYRDEMDHVEMWVLDDERQYELVDDTPCARVRCVEDICDLINMLW